MSTLNKAISILGSATKLANVLGVTTQAVCFWRNGNRQIPAHQCPAIEQATNGLVTCEELRPDIPWGVLRNKQPESMES